MKILVIGTVWPEPQSSAAGWRMLSLLRLFKQQGWAVQFASAAAASPHAFNLASLGIETLPIQLNDSSFDALVRRLQPELVLFDRFMTEEQFGWRVRDNAPDAMCVLDTEDLHGLRQARQQAVAAGRACTRADLFSDVACREIASILRCDLSLIISPHEMQLLQTHFQVPAEALYALPFLIDPPSAKERSKWPDFQARHGFISIGNFRHPPNWDSVQCLKTEIWPRIRARLPEAQLKVYGAYPTKQAQALHAPLEGFHLLGWVDSAQQAMQQARVCLAPLRFGAGLKGKLLQAMQCGTPSVTTAIGAEGMHGALAWNGHIESDPDAFADAAVRLHESPDPWQTMQHNGEAILAQHFDQQRLAPPFIRALCERLDNLSAYRAQNFFCKLLNLQQHQAQRYMSRWIESKNRLRAIEAEKTD